VDRNPELVDNVCWHCSLEVAAEAVLKALDSSEVSIAGMPAPVSTAMTTISTLREILEMSRAQG
jgi:hypothetical protein